jgi:hypothetical protein
MFAKNKVSQSMIDAVNSVISEGKVEEASEKVPTSTGMKVYGSSYGNSAKARVDQTKSAVDSLKGPKAKDLELKPHEKKMQEDLKGNQFKIDANHNNKIDGQDFKILKSKKKVSEESEKEEGHEDAKQDKAMIKKMMKKEEDDCVTKPEVKKIADKEADKKVKGHETRLHKENVFYRFAKELQENKSSGVLPTFTDNNVGEMVTPKKNQDIADKSYLKDKPGSVKSDLKNLGRFLTGKKETNEEVELDEVSSLGQAKKLINRYQSAKDSIKFGGKYDVLARRGDEKSKTKGTAKTNRALKAQIKADIPKHGHSNIPEEVDESVQTQATKTGDKITTDMLTGREKGGKLNSFKSYKVDLTTSGVEAVPKDFETGEDTKEKQKITTNPGPVDIKLDDKVVPPQKYFSKQAQITSEEVRGELKKIRNKEVANTSKEISSFKSHPAATPLLQKNEEVQEVEEKVIAGMSGFKKIKNADEKGNVTDKSGAVHTPMSRAKDAAKLTFAKLKQEMLGKISN